MEKFLLKTKKVTRMKQEEKADNFSLAGGPSGAPSPLITWVAVGANLLLTLLLILALIKYLKK